MGGERVRSSDITTHFFSLRGGPLTALSGFESRHLRSWNAGGFLRSGVLFIWYCLMAVSGNGGRESTTTTTFLWILCQASFLRLEIPARGRSLPYTSNVSSLVIESSRDEVARSSASIVTNTPCNGTELTRTPAARILRIAI